jgi:putative two-component system response regulator
MTGPADGARILVVDDDDMVRLVLARQLEHAGYRCISAGGAAEARRLLAQERCSLMLCDVNMPGETGLDLIGSALAEHPDLATLMISGIDDAETAEAAGRLGAYGYMVKPFGENQLLINVANALRRRDLEIENSAHRERLEELVEQRTLALGEAVRRLERANDELHRSREETIRRLSRAGEYRDEETGEHVQRMGRICYLLAQQLGLDADHCELIRIAGPLHDIGKVGIADSILRKPGPLDDDERALMEEHAEIGYRILSGSDSPLLDIAATIAWTHHERFDGSGYPRGLAGEEIPIEGRIAAVADVFDALTHDRVYRQALPMERALEILREGRGTQFDSAVLDAFLAVRPEVGDIVDATGQTHGGVTVVIVDDHESVRKGLELILRREGCEVVGTAGDAEHAYPLIQRRRPGVAVIDVGLPGENGIELTRRLLAEEGAPRVLLYTGLEDEQSLKAAIEVEASGIACKAGPPRELAAAIREVARGRGYFDPRLGALLAKSSPGAEAVLTAREREIFELLARGLSGEQIAAELFLSPETVRTHVRNGMRKLAARTRVHAVAEALRRREISL